MFDFLKKKKNLNDQSSNTAITATPPAVDEEHGDDSPATPNKIGFFQRLKKGLSKTRASLTAGMGNLFLGKKELTPEVIEEIEMALLSADVGVETTEQLIKKLNTKVTAQRIK